MTINTHYPSSLKIATRRSPLALWQANYVKSSILERYPHIQVELVLLVTEGDKNLTDSLAKIGGKGLFIKELEIALREKRADMAVHCMKDMTVNLPVDLTLAAFYPREDVRDVFVSEKYQTIDQLPVGAIVGTSSLRRQAQLLAMRSDLRLKPLRGNVNTRLDKLKRGEFDAIILAAAGLIRLGLRDQIKQYIPVEQMLPAVGQAIIGVECRTEDHNIIALLQTLNCTESAICLTAERSMNRKLGGTCSTPIAGLATIQDNQLQLQGRVLHPNGQIILSAIERDAIEQAENLGLRVAEQLLSQGAAEIIQGCL
ncbi:MAG: hydroxymethylbilane synthase [Gammaproteobacteria bacterium]